MVRLVVALIAALSLSPASLAQTRCSRALLSQLATNSERKTTPHLSSKTVKPLEKQLRALTLQYHLDDTALITQSGQIRRMKTQFEIKLPGDANYSTVYLVGRPEKIGDETFINLKFWRDGRDRFIGEAHSVAERMTFDDFYSLAKTSFNAATVRENRWLILPLAEPDGIFHQPIKILKKGEKDVLVQLLKGKTRKVSYRELFYSNYHLDDTEVLLLNTFFESGGKGNVLTLQFANPGEFKKEGLYLQIQSLPDKAKIPVRDDFLDLSSIDEIQKMLDQNIPVLLADEWRGVHGAQIPKKAILNPLQESLQDSYIALTPTSDGSVIAHEMMHYQDRLSGSLQHFKDFLMRMDQTVEELPISETDVMKLMTFLSEQRAYAKQLDVLEKLGKQPGTKEIYHIMGNKFVPWVQYAHEKSQATIQFFDAEYGREARQILKKIERSKKLREPFHNYLEEHMAVRRELSFSEIFRSGSRRSSYGRN